MSYLYKTPIAEPVPQSAKPSGADPLKGGIPAPVNEIVTPAIPEKINIVDYPIGLNGTYCKEITYEEHLKNLELMCKADRAFMMRVREFCDDHKEENYPHVEQPIPDQESSSEHAEGSE
jgi:hypothetical protein